MAACAIAACGATLQGTIGFGLALVAAPFLVLIDPVLVPGPLLMAALVLALMMSWREREHLDLHGLKWAVVGRVGGSAAGAALLRALPANAIAVTIGVLVLVAVALSCVGLRVKPDSRGLFWAGTLSGFMGTTSSIGGPPMALIYQDSPGAKLRAMLSSFFVIGTIISVGLLAAFGSFGQAQAKAGAALIPGVVAGFALSSVVRKVLDRRAVRPAVLAVSSVAAVAVIVKTLL